MNTVGTRTVDVKGIFSFQRADDEQESVLSKEQLALLVKMYKQRDFQYQFNYSRKTKIMQGIFQFFRGGSYRPDYFLLSTLENVYFYEINRF